MELVIKVLTTEQMVRVQFSILALKIFIIMSRNGLGVPSAPAPQYYGLFNQGFKGGLCSHFATLLSNFEIDNA
jgi:hypothetical protein